MDWRQLPARLARHMRVITLWAGSVLVAVWTVIRHWTNGVNFDVVGQVGVTDQWSRGMHGGAQLGATNYLLKMPVYYLVNHFGFLSPHLKLLALALLFNVVTFVLLVILFEKLLRLYGVRPDAYFYLAMLWLASISERVYWLDYANSRNLETAGGIWVLYLGCLLLQRISWRRTAAFVGVGGVIFFADQLQIYSIGGGLCLFVVVTTVFRRTRQNVTRTAVIIGSTAAAVDIDLLLHAAATRWLPISFLTAPRAVPDGTAAQTFVHTLGGLLENTARVFDASFYASGSAPNSIREVFNIVVLLGAVAAIGRFARKSPAPRLTALAGCSIIAAYAAYAAGWQALKPMTERYIVMVPLLFVLLLGSVAPAVRLSYARRVKLAWAGALAVSAVLILGALVVSAPNRYSKDAYITDTLSFMYSNRFTLAVGSRNGIPETYFAEGRAIVLPTICTPGHTLVESNLFFDRAAFRKLDSQQGSVPLIVPDGGIVSGDAVCTIRDIERQFGTPVKGLPVSGVGMAEIYPAKMLKLHE